MDATKAEASLSKYLKAVDKIAEEDSVLTTEQQIDRLLRPGAKYRNLNPYEVLQVDRDMDRQAIRKKYRKLSFLVHPDKNPDNREQAQSAFEVVNEAHRALDDEEKMAWVNYVYQEAEEEWPHHLKEKRKEAKKSGLTIPEDRSEANMKESWRKFLIKQFAVKEVAKNKLLNQDSKRKQEEHDKQEEEKERQKRAKMQEAEWKKGRDKRMNAWLNFQGIKTPAQEEEEARSTNSKTSSSSQNQQQQQQQPGAGLEEKKQADAVSAPAPAPEGNTSSISSSQQDQAPSMVASVADADDADSTVGDESDKKKKKKKKKKEKKARVGFRPPKLKSERR